MTQEAGHGKGVGGQAVLVVAGLADLVVSTLGSAIGTAQGLLRRSDASELAAEAQRDLTARGQLALDRYTAAPAHMEILAHNVVARRAVDGA